MEIAQDERQKTIRTLKKWVTIIGSILGVLSMAGTGYSAYFLTLQEDEILRGVSIGIVAAGAVDILVNGLLLLGVVMNNRWLFLPWMIFTVLFMLAALGLVISILVLSSVSYSKYSYGIGYGITFAIYSSMLKTVWRLFKEMGISQPVQEHQMIRR